MKYGKELLLVPYSILHTFLVGKGVYPKHTVWMDSFYSGFNINKDQLK